ncbi:MAG: hypothetical protein KDF64_15910, partial [Geminicoccaceae bacterium]|nr:hypothetical protein [Geminicoccaceae bacterium]
VLPYGRGVDQVATGGWTGEKRGRQEREKGSGVLAGTRRFGRLQHDRMLFAAVQKTTDINQYLVDRAFMMGMKGCDNWYIDREIVWQNIR